MSALSSPAKSFPWIPVAVLLAAFAAVLLIRNGMDSAPSDSSLLEEQASLMGTVWKVHLALGEEEAVEPARRAIEAAWAEVARIESLMSEWRQDSPLSALNRSAGGQAIEVPAELRAILERGIEYGRISQGAFDITWRGMGALWSFEESFRLPSPSQIQTALERVGYQMIRIDGDRVQLPRAGMAIGLGGIAKGYALDRAALILRERGYQDFLLDGGGDLLAQGARGQRPWRAGIRHPRGGPQDLLGAVELRSGQALASSGDYERFRIYQGVRYHHIIDPRTGQPARGCQATSVLAPSAEEADALATAIFVLGPKAGLDLATRRNGAEALIVDPQGQLHTTTGFTLRRQEAGGRRQEERDED